MIRKQRPRGYNVTSLSECCKICSLFDCTCVSVVSATAYVFFQTWAVRGVTHKVMTLAEVWISLSSYFPIVCSSVSLSSTFFFLSPVSPGMSPADVGPSGQSLRRDTRSAWCLGQTLQQRFLCSTHLLVLAHSSRPQRRSGQALANMLVQQPDHFTRDFFCKYGQRQLNVGMESELWASSEGWLKH